jgi:DNA-3-methyladenine glycosylase I
MRDYKAIFERFESSLIKAGSVTLPPEKIRANLDEYRHFEGKVFSDTDYYQEIVQVIFYAGFKAATVTSKLDLLSRHFPDHTAVANYPESKVDEIISDPEMIRNHRKVQACIENARIFQGIVAEYGSFQSYIDSFSAHESFENLMLLKEELEFRFAGLGRITTYHVLTDIGFRVIKPDRVICRIFRRLGLIESEDQLLKTVIQGRKFADATGHPIRYIDIIFVAFGQVQSLEFGLSSGICLEKNPLCSTCGATAHCKYYEKPARDSR